MSRDVVDDFNVLKNFLNDYSLKEIISDNDYESLLSSQHKKYFAILTLISELVHQGVAPVSKEESNREDGQDTNLNQHFLNYLMESVSDLGNSLFVWSQGAYKAARITLRSSLENFFRCLALISYPEVLNLRSTYELIDKFNQIEFFSSDFNKQFFLLLKNAYSILCADVHTASVKNMEKISALGYFPNFNKHNAAAFERLFSQVSQCYVHVLCLMFKKEYFLMHHKNQDIVSLVMSKEVKTLIYSGEF
jgi:hypothetical protein